METPNTPAVGTVGTVSANQQPLPMPPDQSGSSRKRMLIIAGVAVLVIGVVAALFGGDLFKGSFLSGDSSYAITIDSANKDADGKTVLVYTFTNKTGQDIAADSLIEVKGFTDTQGATPFFTRPLNFRSTFRADQSVTMRTTFAPSIIGEYTDISLKVYRGGVEKSSTTTREPVVATGGGSAAPSEPVVPASGGSAVVPDTAPLSEEEAAALRQKMIETDPAAKVRNEQTTTDTSTPDTPATDTTPKVRVTDPAATEPVSDESKVRITEPAPTEAPAETRGQ